MPSAIEQILGIFQTRLIADGLSAEIHRDENEILQSAECPVVALGWGGAEIESPTSCDEYLWRATIIFDCWAKVDTGKPIIAGCADQISIIAAAIRDDYSFGGKFQECVPIAVSDFANIGGDTGCITLTATVLFMTPRGDFDTLI
jgi:hypothetical protein